RSSSGAHRDRHQAARCHQFGLSGNRQGARVMSRTQLEHHWHPSPNIGPRRGIERPELLIVHYTGMDSAKAASAWLCNPASGVSCHYLVDENGSITQMVDESQRAWHAGVS